MLNIKSIILKIFKTDIHQKTKLFTETTKMYNYMGLVLDSKLFFKKMDFSDQIRYIKQNIDIIETKKGLTVLKDLRT